MIESERTVVRGWAKVRRAAGDGGRAWRRYDYKFGRCEAYILQPIFPVRVISGIETQGPKGNHPTSIIKRRVGGA
jgi:hypothetical protein